MDQTQSPELDTSDHSGENLEPESDQETQKPRSGPDQETPRPGSDPDQETPRPRSGPDQETPRPGSDPDQETPRPRSGPDQETPRPGSDPDQETPRPGSGPDQETPRPRCGPDQQTLRPGSGPDQETPRPGSGPDQETPRPRSGPDQETLRPGSGPDQETPRPGGGPDQETPRPRSGPRQLDLMGARIQDLLSRKKLLVSIKNFKRAMRNSGHRRDMTCDDSEELGELDLIENELEELRVRVKEMEEAGEGVTADTGQEVQLFTLDKPESPYGGIFMLPPYEPEPEGPTLEEREESPPPTVPAPPEPASVLGSCPARALCPSCGELVVTQVTRKVDQNTWLMCWTCALMGCLAGCCLIPFYLERLKSSVHRCPFCGAHIHTHHLF